LRLIQNLEKLRDDQHLTGWLITSTRHECGHVLRKKWRENTAEDSESLLQSAATDPLPDERSSDSRRTHRATRRRGTESAVPSVA
jgi:DNA-directed RNA polymerase specialized sigma24 family protein